MKSPNQNVDFFSFTKLINAQLQLISVVLYFFLFGSGVGTGVILSSYLKNVSFSLNVTQFSLSAPTLPPPTLLEHTMKNETSMKLLPRVGLKEYLKVPRVKHDMEDELLWRASMAPRRRKYPFDRVPKVAFMFLTKGPVLMAPLWEKFFKGYDGMFSVYVHSGPDYNDTQHESPVFEGRRIPSKEVEWGNVNMIEAERRLLANALLDISNQRFVLLSESCIPLFNFSTVYNYLINSTTNFIEAYDLEGPVGRGRYSPKMSPEIKVEEWRKGAQWFEMNRELAIEIVSNQTYFPLFKKYCYGDCYADEHYLPTFVSMKHGQSNSNRTLTWVDWLRGGPHPAGFVRNDVTIEFLERMRRGSSCVYNGLNTTTCYLFARKFLPNALDRLLRFAPKILFIY